MITERSIKLLSSVMLISANRIKVWRLWLTCFEDGPIRILTFAWWMLKTRKTMVSWQAFPSLPPRAPLAFLPHLKLPFPSLWNACQAGYAAYSFCNYKHNSRLRSFFDIIIMWNTPLGVWPPSSKFIKKFQKIVWVLASSDYIFEFF